AALRDHNDKGRQVLILAAQAVTEPGAEAGAAWLLMARLNVGDGRVVVDRLGVHRLDDGDVVHDRAHVRQQLADPSATVTTRNKVKRGGHARKRLLKRRHAGHALAHAHGAGQFGAVVLAELRLVVEQVDVRGAA